MTPTKRYAIKCSTEEQARECNIKKLKSGISPDIINFYRNKGYSIISYSEAKEKGLLGERYLCDSCWDKPDSGGAVIEKLNEVSPEVRNNINPDIVNLWDKLNEVIDRINKQ